MENEVHAGAREEISLQYNMLSVGRTDVHACALNV